MATLVAYKFRGIQRYLQGGGRLTDVAGGSEIIDSLCSAALTNAFQALEIPITRGEDTKTQGDDNTNTVDMDPAIGRVLVAASGQIILLFNDDDKARDFVRLWPLFADLWAPNGRHAIAATKLSGATTLTDEIDTLGRRVNSGPGLPPFDISGGGPLSWRSRRTGAPVVVLFKRPTDDNPDPSPHNREIEDRDASTVIRARWIGRDKGDALGRLARRFGFPDTMTPPFTHSAKALALAGGSSLLAVIHADGTGFGALFKTAADHAKTKNGHDATQALSHCIKKQMEEAAKAAMAPFLDDKNPLLTDPDVERETTGKAEAAVACRPILLGGDDMTVVVPAIHGLTVAETFLSHLETHSHGPMQTFAREHLVEGTDWPTHLTAAAGIAFVHAHFPFRDALALADSLAIWAKTGLGPLNSTRSGLMFHHALDTDSADFTAILDGSYRIPGAPSGEEPPPSLLTAGPYLVGKTAPETPAHPVFFSLNDLRALTGIAKRVSVGTWREIATLVRASETEAEKRLKRLFEILSPTDRADLQAALVRFTGTPDCRTIWVPPHKEGWVRRTPIFDVDCLLGLGQRNALMFDDPTAPTKTEADHVS